ncbi:hypothetical protein BO94DRAFT_574865 [Aspergillus sclerotioniger CBS 115572]|uniref:Heterokaryon incompatibility domain-containing protein n=1 Tax=Aspergillus sclerotioniger CBS 115572 TaxID=1450535 RepID=A0A317WQZ9_9EURO|nr:hypothetical protein BO94DRAFT_574865 [Aspergillus sclerotioniger CBS 115572]PWY88863.1 hypothetical protein BO94DRAFT_574865 [Aspergillus sclerotioniger CBS 115572]
MGQSYSRSLSSSPAHSKKWQLIALKKIPRYTDGTLCRNCADLPIWETLADNTPYSGGLARTIILSASCTHCGIVIEALRGQPHPLYEEIPTTAVYRVSGQPSICIYLSDKSGGRDLRSHIRLLAESRMRLTTRLLSHHTLDGDHFGRTIKQQIDFRLVRSWLDECINHADHDCGSVRSDLPFILLIDVQDRRLVRARGHVKYLALSYVWGQVGGLQTVTQNYKAVQEKGSLCPDNPDIPRVITDSMILVQQLNERYLWVDRLCIIQDMGKMQTMACQVLDLGLGPADDQTSEGRRPYACTSRPSLCFTASRYTSRGWTFQEVLLSPRRLFISDRQAYFTCMEGNGAHCEDRNHTLDYLSFKQVYGLTDRLGLYGGLVESYTRRTLTYDSDILDAFSGISSILMRDNPMHGWEELYSGLPRREFLYSLLWSPIETPVRRPPRRADLIEESFPSWSWIGWKGLISYQPVWAWSNMKGREEVFAPGPIKLIQPNGAETTVYQPQGGSHEGYCSCAIWERSPYTPACVHGTSEPISGPSSPASQSVLHFRTLSIPADSFSYEEGLGLENDGRIGCFRLFHEQECGVIIGQLPRDINLDECMYIFLCYGKELPKNTSVMRMGVYNVLCRDSDWCGCIPFCLLVRGCEGFWERVGLAIIQPMAFEAAQPKWEDIQLA